MPQSTSTSSSGSSSGGHQSVKEQHLGPTISHSNTFAQPSLHSADCDVAEHVHRPTTLSRSGACSNNNSSNTNSSNNTCKLILSFSVTFVAIHQLLVHPSLTLLMTSSSSQSSHYHAKRCVETSEPNIFHCTDYATTPSSRSKSNSNEQQRGKDSILHDNNNNNNNNNNDVIPNKYRGVAQYVSGSEDERRNMVEVLQSMEQYWRRWMLKTASIMQQYDEIEFANIWYVVVFVVICLS